MWGCSGCSTSPPTLGGVGHRLSGRGVVTAHCGFVSFTLLHELLSHLCVCLPLGRIWCPCSHKHTRPAGCSVCCSKLGSCPGSASLALRCLPTVTLNTPFFFFFLAQNFSLLSMGVGDGILRSRHITLPTKICLVQTVVFPVVMYGCESWATKKAECRRIAAFELQCWRRLLRVPWTARKSNQSILKEISPGISWKD